MACEKSGLGPRSRLCHSSPTSWGKPSYSASFLPPGGVPASWGGGFPLPISAIFDARITARITAVAGAFGLGGFTGGEQGVAAERSAEAGVAHFFAAEFAGGLEPRLVGLGAGQQWLVLV